METIIIQGRIYQVQGYIPTNIFRKPIPVLNIRMMEDKKVGGGK